MPPSIPTLNHVLQSRSEEHTSELQSRLHLVCRLLLEKKKKMWQRERECISYELRRQLVRVGGIELDLTSECARHVGYLGRPDRAVGEVEVDDARILHG